MLSEFEFFIYSTIVLLNSLMSNNNNERARERQEVDEEGEGKNEKVNKMAMEFVV
jgi:hypothetical protein